MRAEATSFLSWATVLAAAVGFALPQPAASAASRVFHSNQDGFSVGHTNQDFTIPGLEGLSDPTESSAMMIVADWYMQPPAAAFDAPPHGAGWEAPPARFDAGFVHVAPIAAPQGPPASVIPAPGTLSLITLLLAWGRRHRRR